MGRGTGTPEPGSDAVYPRSTFQTIDIQHPPTVHPSIPVFFDSIRNRDKVDKPTPLVYYVVTGCRADPAGAKATALGGVHKVVAPFTTPNVLGGT